MSLQEFDQPKGVDPKVLEAEREKSAENLQAQLTDEVDFLHTRLSRIKPGRVHEDARDRITRLDHIRLVDALTDDVKRISALTVLTPPRFHIEAEISPKAYYVLGGVNFSFLEKRKTPDAIRYLLVLNRTQTLKDGRLSEFILEAHEPTGDLFLPFFTLADRQGSLGSKFLNLRDLLNLRVVPTQATTPH